MVLADDTLHYPTDEVSKIVKASCVLGLSICVTTTRSCGRVQTTTKKGMDDVRLGGAQGGGWGDIVDRL